MAMPITSPFLWGAGGQQLTPEQVSRLRQSSMDSAIQASDTSPVGHWSGALARALQGYGSYRGAMRADKAEAEGLASADELIRSNPTLASYLGGDQQAPQGVQPGAQIVDAMKQPAQVPQSGLASAIRSGLIQRGMPEHVADGFLMNFQDESGLDPGINEQNPTVPGSRGGFGLSQWTGPRRRQLEAFAQSRGVPVSDMDMQLDFLVSELQGTESAAARRIMATSTPGEAGAAIVNAFLRPAEEHRARRESAYLGGAPRSGGMPGAATAAPSQAPNSVVAALAQASANPWVQKKYGPVIEALMGQEMQRSNADYQQQLAQQDPMYQAQLQHQQLQNQALMNPAAPKPIEVGGVLLDPTTYQPIFDSRQPGDGGFTLSEGQQRFDAQGNPIASVAAAPPEQFSVLSNLEIAELGLPPGAYQRGADGKISQIGSGGVTVNNNMGGDQFNEAFAKGDAAMIGAISEAGIAAQRNLSRIDQLEGLLSESPSGFAAAAAQRAGEWGINTQGLDTLQAAQAMINSLVPEQRQPGSGPMSDADLALFKQSLPRLINQPGGNQRIIQTMRAIAQYDAEGAQITQALRSGQIDRAQAFQMLQDRKNPMAGFKAPEGYGATSAQSGADGWQDVGGVKIRRKQ